MIKFLKVFLIFVVLYHIFVTVIGYGVLGGAYPQLPALGRDAIWLLFFVIISLANFRTLKIYLKTWKRPRITFIIIILFGVGISLLKGKGIGHFRRNQIWTPLSLHLPLRNLHRTYPK
ncbi:MAG: hypothetical protein WC606_04095 [Candidatus Absconditabacterales bacterium]